MNQLCPKSAFFFVAALLCCLFPAMAFMKNIEVSSALSPDATQGSPDIVWMRGGNKSPQGGPFFLADGQRFVTASAGTIQWWRASDGILLRTFYPFSGISDLALSPNKQIIAAVSADASRSVKLIDANDGTLLREIALQGDRSSYVAFSPDGQTMAINSGPQSIIQLWRISDGALLRTYNPPYNPESGDLRLTGRPAFSTDGQYISGSMANQDAVVIVRVSDGSLVKRYDFNYYPPFDAYMFFSRPQDPGQQYFLAGRYNQSRLAVWRLSDPCTFETCEPVATLIGGFNDAYFKNFVLSPDGSKLGMGGQGAQSPYPDINRVWNTSNWGLIRSYESNNITETGAAIAFTPDGVGILSVSHNMKLWSVADGSLIRNLEGHSDEVRSVAYSPDGQVVASAGATYIASTGIKIPGIYLWRASDGVLLRTMDFGENLAGWVNSLVFSPDGQTVAATGSVFPNNTQTLKVKLFNTSTGALIRTIDSAGGEALVFSPDGQTIATGGGFGGTKLYNVSDGTLREVIDISPQTLSFSPDGARITDGRAVYQVSNGSFLFNISGNPTHPKGASYSPDGQLIATVSGDSVKICNAGNGALVRVLTGHTANVNVAVFSPDSNALLTAGLDNTVRLWRVSDGALLETYSEETGTPTTQIFSAAFSPDGQFFIYGRNVDATIVMARNPLVSPPPTDTTAPVITPTVTGTLGNAGWYTSDVEVSWSVTDPESGVSTSTGCETTSVKADTTGVTFTCSATSGGGSANQSVTIKRDGTAPSVSCGSADGAWHSSDASVVCTPSDNFSQLANAGDTSFSLTTGVPAGTETANASTGSRTIYDNAGNFATAGPVNGNKIDKEAPTITITTPSASAIYLLNQSIASSYLCSDGGSGVGSCAGPVPSGSSTDTASAGGKTFTVNATDQVGNTATQSLSYTIRYGVGVLYDQTKVHKGGGSVPIKIRVVDATGVNYSSASLIVQAMSVMLVSANSSGTLEDAGNSNTDLNFHYDSSLGGYIFNLRTTGYAAGSYELHFFVAGDPTDHVVQFRIRQ